MSDEAEFLRNGQPYGNQNSPAEVRTCSHGKTGGHYFGNPADGYWCDGPGHPVRQPRGNIPLAEVFGIATDDETLKLSKAMLESGPYGVSMALLTLVTELRELVSDPDILFSAYDDRHAIVWPESITEAVDTALEWLYDQNNARAKALAKESKP